MKKALTEYTDRELLKKFVEEFAKYDSLRDDELDFLGDNPNRDFWDDDMETRYEELCDEINDQYDVLFEMQSFINNLK